MPNKRSSLLSWANNSHGERAQTDSDFNVFTVVGSHAHVSRPGAWSDLARSEKMRRRRDRIGIPGRTKIQAMKPPLKSNQAEEPEERQMQGRIDNGPDTQGQRNWWKELGRQRLPRKQTYPFTSLEHADTTVNCLKRHVYLSQYHGILLAVLQRMTRILAILQCLPNATEHIQDPVHLANFWSHLAVPFSHPIIFLQFPSCFLHSLASCLRMNFLRKKLGDL